MLRRPRVIVIGAGVIGASLAWRLAQRGAPVTVLEARTPGAGTSSTSFAWVNASSKHADPPAYFELNHAALREHHALAGKLPAQGWLFPTGNIELVPRSAAGALESAVAQLRERGYGADLVTRNELGRLEPGIRPPAGGMAAFYAEEAWVHVPSMMARLIQLARDAGAMFIADSEAGEIVTAGRAACGVRLACGDIVEAEVVVSALGRWTADFTAHLDFRIPLVAPDAPGSPAVGLLATVAPASSPPRRLLHGPEVNWSPQPDGRALLASDTADQAVARDRSPGSIAAAAQALLERASALSPVFQDAAIVQTRLGLRALPVDGVSICGWAGPVDGFYVVVTHSGVTLAPLLAELVASEVVDGRTEPRLEPFRPARFGS
jgi:glycine/D-amino acid oxidase-like deaminating enzyme